jgi:hypothetical protein
MNITAILAALFNPADLLILKGLAIYIVADAVISALLSVKSKGPWSDFSLVALGDFVRKFGGPFAGLALLAILGNHDPLIHALFYASAGAYTVSDLADLKGKIADAFGPQVAADPLPAPVVPPPAV